MYQHLSQDGKDRRGVTEDEFTLRRKLTSIQNRDRFLKDCLEEQVLPRSAPKHLHHPHKPFSNTAREYLKEARETLRNEESMIRSRLKKDHIPHGLVLKIKEEDRIQKAKLQMKLEHLCNNSRWKEVGRHELITNLSSLRLTKTQEEALSLGLKFSTGINHKTTADYVEKNYNWRDSELENGFKQGLILCCSLASRKREPAIPRRYTRALKELRDNNDILITTADKGGEDRTKFQPIQKNPIPELTSKVNKIIDVINAVAGGITFCKLSGEYKPGYCYGNVKTHKPNNPLRPIISQIPTPTYQLAKKLNELLTPFVPSRFSLASSHQFIELVNNLNGFLASVDGPTTPKHITEEMLRSYTVEASANVQEESYMSNMIRYYKNSVIRAYVRTAPKVCSTWQSLHVEMKHIRQIPVNDGFPNCDFDLIYKVYHSNHVPLDIPETLLRKLLETCTTESPFRGPDGKLYRQVDGVAMASPHGVLFASFYMGLMERRVLFDPVIRPHSYGRYVDDIFVETRDHTLLQEICEAFANNSCLNFTSEHHADDSLPFLDISVKPDVNRFTTTVYVKSTNKGRCLNADVVCPAAYNKSVIHSYVKRAFTHCSTWPLLHQELQRLQQVLVDNVFINKGVQEVIRKKKMESYLNHDTVLPKKRPTVILNYRPFMSTAYRTDERILRFIATDRVPEDVPIRSKRRYMDILCDLVYAHPLMQEV
ncbi:uncharacterized protein LOC143039026 [Oratosquilla oratoria]|uniref:uncharacterized protein LOC143039026 n=1 Tax=Oratosquilla oratoria TaxID=337810 RepID=UPI003F7611A1